MVNYLARLGWSHGDDEIFSREQFLQWFNLDHLGRSAAQFDEAKLRWVNAQHLKAMDDAALAQLVLQQLKRRGIDGAGRELDESHLAAICALFKDRCDTTVALADWAARIYAPVQAPAEDLAKHVTEQVRPAIGILARMLEACPWDKGSISEAIKETLRATGLKMPQLAMPVRVLVMGTAQTPSLDAVLALCGRADVVARLDAA
jgi:glutamyl-tRNA synthetase